MSRIATLTELDGPAPLTLLTISVGQLDPDELADHLTSGVELLSHDLVSAKHRRIGVDVRLPDAPLEADLGLHEAYVELARGLVQGYVAESGADVEPVNVVISTESQDRDRETTWRFLGDPQGGLARGATLDLRRHR